MFISTLQSVAPCVCVCEQSGILLYLCRWWAQRMASWTLTIPQPDTPTLPSLLPLRLKWLTKPSTKQLFRWVEDCAASCRVGVNSILLSPNINNEHRFRNNLHRFHHCILDVHLCLFKYEVKTHFVSEHTSVLQYHETYSKFRFDSDATNNRILFFLEYFKALFSVTLNEVNVYSKATIYRKSFVLRKSIYAWIGPISWKPIFFFTWH